MEVKVNLQDNNIPFEKHTMIIDVPDNCITDEMVELFIRNNTGGSLISWKRLHE